MKISNLDKANMTSKRARELLAKYGKNQVEENQRSWVLMLISQIFNPMILLLLLAAVITWLTDSKFETLVIAIIILLNTSLGFIQEYRSNKVFNKLSKLIPSQAKVYRNKTFCLIDKADIVPGDYISLKLGDIVPADCYVIENESAMIDESSLTGESMPVSKLLNKKEDKTNTEGLLFAGSNIKSGTLIAKVYATGKNTTFGKTVRLNQKERRLSEYEQNIRKLSRDIIIISILSVAIVFILNNIFQTHTNIIQLLLFTVAISITIIPEALPVITTITLSISAAKLGKHGAVIKQLASIESLGNIDIICTDKTGTLTENVLRLMKTDINPKFKNNFYEYCYLASVNSKDPFDIAIQDMLALKEYKYANKIGDYKDIPFNPFKKISSRKIDDLIIIKGSTEIILKQCNLTEDIIESVENNGYRKLSLAIKKGKRTEYLGSLYFYDPIKQGVKEILENANRHGISIKIITGDSFEISTFVANNLGLSSKANDVIEASELLFSEPNILEQQVQQHTVFCRADPIQKYKIVEALQQNATVAYLGDGINDAPSLNLADVGIVVSNSSDIAKESADVILLNRNLIIIIDAILEGRKSFANIEKYIIHTLTSNFGNFLTIGILSLFLPYLPMLPIQILISNLIIDFSSLSFSFDSVDKEQLKKPLHTNFNKLISFVIILALVSSVLDFLFFIWANNKLTPNETQTLWFVTSGITELLLFLSLRTKRLFINSKPNYIMLIIISIATILLIITSIIGIPELNLTILNTSYLPAILTIPVVYFMLTELIKIRINKIIKY